MAAAKLQLSTDEWKRIDELARGEPAGGERIRLRGKPPRGKQRTGASYPLFVVGFRVRKLQTDNKKPQLRSAKVRRPPPSSGYSVRELRAPSRGPSRIVYNRRTATLNQKCCSS